MVDQINFYRQQIETCCNIVSDLKPLKSGIPEYPFPMNSWEIEQIIKSLKLANAWLMMDEVQLGNSIMEGWYFSGSYKEQIEWLILKIKEIQNELSLTFRNTGRLKYPGIISTHLQEAIFFLEFELERYKKDQFAN